MRTRFDSTANAAYICLVPIGPGEAVETIASAEAEQVKGMFNLDFNNVGQLIGIEVLNATEVLPSEVLRAAERMDCQMDEGR